MSFKYYNANAKGRHTNDCVIRAISLAEDKTWNETYKELSELAQSQGILLDDVEFVEPLLDSKYQRTCYQKTFVGDFIEDHPKGTYLITMKGHITCVIDGVLYDSFDCRNRVMWCAWTVKKD
jgi:hypothetical protein